MKKRNSPLSERMKEILFNLYFVEYHYLEDHPEYREKEYILQGISLFVDLRIKQGQSKSVAKASVSRTIDRMYRRGLIQLFKSNSLTPTECWQKDPDNPLDWRIDGRRGAYHTKFIALTEKGREVTVNLATPAS